MKIAFIGQKAIPFSEGGGVERHVEELATRLAKAGNEVTVYVRPRYVATPEDIWQKIKLVRVFSVPTKHWDTISYTFFATLHAVFHRGSTSGGSTSGEVEPPYVRRMRAFLECQDGFELAEKDLKLRGPGDSYGTAQTGFMDFKIASFADVDIAKQAKQAAEDLLKRDPELKQYPELRQEILDKEGTAHLE